MTYWLFDIDGTLVDSTPAVERAWRTWAAENDLDAEAILQVNHGRRAKDTLADVIAPELVDAAYHRLLALEMADLDSVVALPGAAELLAALPRDRWAAVTSGGRELMSARLRASGLPVPEVLVTAEDVEAGKPDPAGYLLAAERLGAHPAECIVVEDAPAGLEAGRRAGCRVIAVATSHSPEQLAGWEVIPDLTHLLP
ncbi:HAD-superfamily hydrolase [Corynebacterium humireducens NBRC 106098 = DSM 45392]|uniref:HAD-superfamily hydrolase n=1 Tax=Corynebacterium humireducens NBRC 106098 = DSM 45392 TaxID=1223515 RepID=A0A0B5DA37_9CORY|nr:HAD family hydrolase [Corynebacterium humireducens]AJE33053.1 HAD-superfamily hydrolase [Corynebacterium humireducens NBRC 106098 = DSM 45392]